MTYGLRNRKTLIRHPLPRVADPAIGLAVPALFARSEIVQLI
jgi:hypothetical protein